ncbi:MAG: hypothetical protein WEG36_04560 [Gemmatimonadota bacterium]
MTAPRRWLRGVFIAFFLLAQTVVPLSGLYASHLLGHPFRFSWQMFSRIPAESAESDE